MPASSRKGTPERPFGSFPRERSHPPAALLRDGRVRSKRVWRENLESHLVGLEVRPLPFEEPVYGLVLAAAEEHDDRVPGDRHFEGTSDQGHGVSPHAHVDPGELLNDASGLPSRADESGSDLRDPVLRMGEVLDI